MDDEADPTEALEPSSPRPEQLSSTLDPCEAAGLHPSDQCDAVSPEVGHRIPSQDVASDKEVDDERAGVLMGRKSLVAAVDQAAVQVAFEDESVVKKDESESLHAGEIRDSSNTEIEVEVVHGKDGDSENVEEVQSPATGENGGERVVDDLERKDYRHDNFKVEGTEEVEIQLPRHLSDTTEEKGEPICVCEENVVPKLDDDSKQENEALTVDSSGLEGAGSQTVCQHSVSRELSRKDIGRKEHSEEGMDDHNPQLNGNDESKGQEDTAQMDENAGSPLVGDKEVVAREELSQEDTGVFWLNGDVELQEEDKLTQTDDMLRSPFPTNEEDDAQVIDQPTSAVSQDVAGGEDAAAVGITRIETLSEAEAREGINEPGSGANSKGGFAAKVSGKISKVLVEEDVCFVCLDGGNLVLCDRRGCPKAYHPSCVDRDEAFFQEKGRWTCGWHLCSKCEKNAFYMCCTCPFSLCKGCIKAAFIFCLRGNKGLCEACIKTVMLIENNVQGDDMAAFDDKSQWEYLFKDYWIEQKEKLSFTAEEIAQAKNAWRGFDVDKKQGTPRGKFQVSNEAGNASNSSLADAEVITVKRKNIKKQIRSGNEIGSDTDSSLVRPDGNNTKKKAKRWLKPLSEEGGSDSDNPTRNRERAVSRSKKTKKLGKSQASGGALMNHLAERGTSPQGNTEWASKELLEFVLHMKNGDSSVLSQFDVQELLLEYIKRNKLRDPQRRSQIVCDPLLERLFGKPHVGYFEMLKLLESHFLMKDDSQANDNQGSVVDTEVSQMDVDENASAFDRHKKRKKSVDRGLQSNLGDYAAVDMHNVTLIYLRRNLMEALLEESKRFREKVVGSFVRIRISGSMQKQDMYRLVQVVGTSKAAEPYKVGKRITDVMLEILNLDKNELVSIDTISNQEFTEDECKRLRQSFKCGLLSRLTVGDVLEKAKELHQVRVAGWIEAEIVRLRHLCDRASDLGHKRELRENVQKLQLLKKPEECQRRLDEAPIVHADPKMDPTYVSDDESEMENVRLDINMRQRESGSLRPAIDQFSACSNEFWSPTAMPSNGNSELSRNILSKGFSGRREDAPHVGETTGRSLFNQGVDRGTPQSNNWEKSSGSADPRSCNFTNYRFRNNASPSCGPQTSPCPSAMVSQVDERINEADKLWHYQDPTGKVQGPFSIVQLRKWNASGFFPVDLRIWKTTETIDDSIRLTSALAGKFEKEPSVVIAGPSNTKVTGTSPILPADGGKPHESVSQPKSSRVFPPAQPQQVTSSLSDLSSGGSTAPSSVVVSKFSTSIHNPNSGGRQDSSKLVSPTPPQGSVASARKRNSVSRWSPAIYTNNSISSDVIEIIPTRRGNGMPMSSNMVRSEARQMVRSSEPPSSEPSTGSVASSHAPGNGQQMSSQSTVVGEAQKVQVTSQYPLLSQNGATLLMKGVQGVQNLAQTAAVQSPPSKDSGSGSAVRPEMVNPCQMPGNSQAWVTADMQNNASMVQAQHPAYGYWINAPVSGQFQGAANLSNQSFAGIPSQIQWNPQVPLSMPWGIAAAQIPGVPPITMPANPNMGWAMATPGMAVGPTLAAPVSGQVIAQQAGPAAGANIGWVVPTGNPSAWGSEQNENSGGGARQGGVCKFYENGHCKKGASCDYLHS